MKRPQHTKQLGKKGEDIAVDYLEKHGYAVIDRNFKARYGELDIICLKAGVLVFVEVKTRIGEAFGKPEEAVTPKKLREVIQTAHFYCSHNQKLPKSLRLDVIGIELDSFERVTRLNHVQNVTQ